MMLAGISMPSTKELEITEKKIGKSMTERLGDKDINHMIKEKERFMLNPKNYAMYKSRLTKERDNALQVIIPLILRHREESKDIRSL